MDVQVDHENAFQAELRNCCRCGDGDVVEQTEALAAVRKGVVSAACGVKIDSNEGLGKECAG